MLTASAHCQAIQTNMNDKDKSRDETHGPVLAD